MSIKVFQTNKAGKIEFTRCELEKMLNETYNEGYRDGENHVKNSYWTWTSPSITTPYYTTNAIRTNDENIAGVANGTSSISATNCTINPDEAKKISVKTPSNKDASIAPNTQEIKGVDGMIFNLNDMVKAVDALMSGKSDLFALYDVNDITTKNDPCSNLKKELRNL